MTRVVRYYIYVLVYSLDLLLANNIFVTTLWNCLLFCVELGEFISQKKSGGYSTQLSPSCLRINLFKGLQYFLDLIKHPGFTQALGCIVYGHSKIFVDLATIHSHLSGSVFEDALILLFQYFNEFFIDHGIHVDQLAFVHMQGNCLFFTFTI